MSFPLLSSCVGRCCFQHDATEVLIESCSIKTGGILTDCSRVGSVVTLWYHAVPLGSADRFSCNLTRFQIAKLVLPPPLPSTPSPFSLKSQLRTSQTASVTVSSSTRKLAVGLCKSDFAPHRVWFWMLGGSSHPKHAASSPQNRQLQRLEW